MLIHPSTLILCLGLTPEQAFVTPSQPGAYAKIEAALSAQKHTEAKAQLSQIPEAERMPRYHSLLRLKAGLPISSTERAALLARKDPTQARALPLLARAALTQDPEAAVKLWLQSEDPSAISGGIAALRRAKHKSQAKSQAKSQTQSQLRKLVQALLLRFPESHEAEAILKRRPIQSLLKTRAERLERARQLAQKNLNAQAERELRALDRKKAPLAERCEIAYLRGRAARNQHRYTPAIQRLRWARLSCPLEQASAFPERSAYLEARIWSLRKNSARVLELADWFAKWAPEHSFRDDVLFMLAESEETNGRLKAARRHYMTVADMPDADHRLRAKWRLARLALNQGDTQKATWELTGLLAQPGLKPDIKARASYWLAKLQIDTQTEASKRRFEALTRRPSFYGFLALSWLRAHRPAWAASMEAKLLAEARRKPLPLSLSPQLLKAPALQAARRWFAEGRPNEAAFELQSLLQGDAGEVQTAKAQAGAELAASDRLWLAGALAVIGHLPEAEAELRWRPKPEDGELNEKSLSWWRLAYSRPFSKAIHAAAKAEGLDPWVLTALAREESSFDPEIISWAGAIGLTQLMPPTARNAFKRVFKKPLKDLRKLRDPELNLRLGAHVLKEGLDRFRGSLPLALYAYNAGHRAALAALPKKQKPHFDLWLENVKLEETRRYMRRVSESVGIYRLLALKAAPFVDLPAKVSRPHS